MDQFVRGDIFVHRPPRQTLKAWQPFWDCVSILFQFQNSDVADGDVELAEWRLNWVAGVALLRTIGHVLAKVDAKESERHSEEIAAFWRELKSHPTENEIFWEFIEKERNNLLKTYSFGGKLAVNSSEAYIEFEDGSDAFQLFRCAVYWWRHHLMTIEARLQA